MTLHVFLQVHATATLQGPEPTDLSVSCQAQIEATVRALHAEGRLRSVVAEGVVARGSSTTPRATSSVPIQTQAAASRLISVPGIDV